MKNRKQPEMADSDNPIWQKKTFMAARPAKDVLPEIFDATTSSKLLKIRGRPKLEKPKERINIRLSFEVIEYFKASGNGWQTRIDAALKEYIHR